MTRDDEFLGRLETYLDEYEGVTPLPDAVRDAIRAALPKTKQAGPLSGLARFTAMNATIRYGVAAAVLGLAALVGLSIFSGEVGPPTTSPTPNPTASAAPSTGDAALPVELQHPFLGPAHDLPEGWSADGAELVFSGVRFEYNTSAGALFLSRASQAGPRHFRLEALGSNGCTLGVVGTYGWELASDGHILTLTADDDPCQARAAALTGAWLRSNCASPDNACLGALNAGSYSSAYFEPRLGGEYSSRFGAFTYTVPAGWASASDYPDVYGLTTQEHYATWDGRDCYDCPGTRDLIAVLSDPGAATEDCAETNVPGIGFSKDDLVAWLSEHPGLVVSDVEDHEVNGMPATSIVIEAVADWTGTCDPENPFAAVPVFYREDSYHWALASEDRYFITLINIGGGHTVAAVADTADPADLEAFVAEAAPIIATFEFPLSGGGGG